MALSLLNDDGIIAGCEGDLQSIFTLLAVKALTGKDGFMANPSMINSRTNELILAHCTVGLKQTERYIIRNHFETEKGEMTMCTAAIYKTADFYFGRTLDYEFSYGDEVTITPRNYRFDFRHMGILESHYAIIGMAYVAGGYPLYYDGINEKGLGMAGLNFVGNAKFQPIEEGRDCLLYTSPSPRDCS